MTNTTHSPIDDLASKWITLVKLISVLTEKKAILDIHASEQDFMKLRVISFQIQDLINYANVILKNIVEYEKKILMHIVNKEEGESILLQLFFLTYEKAKCQLKLIMLKSNLATVLLRIFKIKGDEKLDIYLPKKDILTKIYDSNLEAWELLLNQQNQLGFDYYHKQMKSISENHLHCAIYFNKLYLNAGIQHNSSWIDARHIFQKVASAHELGETEKLVNLIPSLLNAYKTLLESNLKNENITSDCHQKLFLDIDAIHKLLFSFANHESFKLESHETILSLKDELQKQTKIIQPAHYIYHCEKMAQHKLLLDGSDEGPVIHDFLEKCPVMFDNESNHINPLDGRSNLNLLTAAFLYKYSDKIIPENEVKTIDYLVDFAAKSEAKNPDSNFYYHVASMDLYAYTILKKRMSYASFYQLLAAYTHFQSMISNLDKQSPEVRSKIILEAKRQITNLEKIKVILLERLAREKAVFIEKTNFLKRLCETTHQEKNWFKPINITNDSESFLLKKIELLEKAVDEASLTFSAFLYLETSNNQISMNLNLKKIHVNLAKEEEKGKELEREIKKLQIATQLLAQLKQEKTFHEKHVQLIKKGISVARNVFDIQKASTIPPSIEQNTSVNKFIQYCIDILKLPPKDSLFKTKQTKIITVLYELEIFSWSAFRCSIELTSEENLASHYETIANVHHALLDLDAKRFSIDSLDDSIITSLKDNKDILQLRENYKKDIRSIEDNTNTSFFTRWHYHILLFSSIRKYYEDQKLHGDSIFLLRKVFFEFFTLTEKIAKLPKKDDELKNTIANFSLDVNLLLHFILTCIANEEDIISKELMASTGVVIEKCNQSRNRIESLSKLYQTLLSIIDKHSPTFDVFVNQDYYKWLINKQLVRISGIENRYKWETDHTNKVKCLFEAFQKRCENIISEFNKHFSTQPKKSKDKPSSISMDDQSDEDVEEQNIEAKNDSSCVEKDEKAPSSKFYIVHAILVHFPDLAQKFNEAETKAISIKERRFLYEELDQGINALLVDAQAQLTNVIRLAQKECLQLKNEEFYSDLLELMSWANNYLDPIQKIVKLYLESAQQEYAHLCESRDVAKLEQISKYGRDAWYKSKPGEKYKGKVSYFTKRRETVHEYAEQLAALARDIEEVSGDVSTFQPRQPFVYHAEEFPSIQKKPSTKVVKEEGKAGKTPTFLAYLNAAKHSSNIKKLPAHPQKEVPEPEKSIPTSRTSQQANLQFFKNPPEFIENPADNLLGECISRNRPRKHQRARSWDNGTNSILLTTLRQQNVFSSLERAQLLEKISPILPSSNI